MIKGRDYPFHRHSRERSQRTKDYMSQSHKLEVLWLTFWWGGTALNGYMAISEGRIFIFLTAVAFAIAAYETMQFRAAKGDSNE